MRHALIFVLMSVLLTACQHAQISPRLSQAELAQEAALKRPTDAEARLKMIGTWVAEARTDDDEYQTMTIRPDGSFVTVGSDCEKLVVEGTWRIESGMLRLTPTNGVHTPNGFRLHGIEYVDDHKLVCGIDISTAGRMRFTR
jgi:hypothetical protein